MCEHNEPLVSIIMRPGCVMFYFFPLVRTIGSLLRTHTMLNVPGSILDS